jgi:hypothetical protein
MLEDGQRIQLPRWKKLISLLSRPTPHAPQCRGTIFSPVVNDAPWRRIGSNTNIPPLETTGKTPDALLGTDGGNLIVAHTLQGGSGEGALRFFS